MLTHSSPDHLRFAGYPACRWSPILTVTGKMILGICKHVLDKFKPRTTLTVEITNFMPNCDKKRQNLYNSVPIFVRFNS